MTMVKICGITNLADALHAIDAGADALGFNFYERSPRYISPQTADDIIKKLPSEILTVGVVVNQSLDEIERYLTQTSIKRVQLHGDESPEYVASIVNRSGPVVIKAIRVGSRLDIPSAAAYEHVDQFLLDASSPHAYGGTGESFDWKLALEFKEQHPDFFLAGGLTPDNVADAVRTVRPSGVDVCSGVESSKGKKDNGKVTAFVRNVRTAL